MSDKTMALAGTFCGGVGAVFAAMHHDLLWTGLGAVAMGLNLYNYIKVTTPKEGE